MINSSYHTTSIAQWAQEAGKGTGFVTTCTVVDASPVGLYGHTASRWVISGEILIPRSAPHLMGRNKRALKILVVVRSSLGVEPVTSYSESYSTVPWRILSIKLKMIEILNTNHLGISVIYCVCNFKVIGANTFKLTMYIKTRKTPNEQIRSDFKLS